MLEIILIVIFSQKLATAAKDKGLPGAWGALFAAGWIGGEIIGFVLGSVVLGDSLGVYLLALVSAIAGGVAAWFVVQGLSPAQGFERGLGVPGVPTHVQADPHSSSPVATRPRLGRRAGYCMDCGENVWLTGVGACPNGHGPQSLTRIYTVED